VLLPHIIGDYEQLTKRNVSWEQIVEHSEIVVAFGGMALKNSMVAGGGTSKHVERGAMARAVARGCQFRPCQPAACDLPEEARSQWISNIPGTDTALMLALVHTLVVERLHDRAFLDRFTSAGRCSSATSRARPTASPRTRPGLPPSRRCGRHHRGAGAKLHGRRALIRGLALAATRRTWRAAGLDGRGSRRGAGQIGLPGGGYAYALGAIAYYGRRYNSVPIPTLSQARNASPNSSRSPASPTCCSIPAAAYRYNGKTKTYPDISLVYWAGGNPFHHHQDLNRLRARLRRWIAGGA
jgi:biotin/methionine sulfoxide reductase